MAERSKENATDLLMFGRELRYFINMDIKFKSVFSTQRFWAEKTNVNMIQSPLCLFMVVSFKCVWQLRSHNITFCPCSNAVFCSALGSDPSSVPSLASSQSTWGTLRQSLKSLSVEFAVLSDKAAQQVQPSVLHAHHLLSCARPKLPLGSKCCFANVLRADGKRTMLSKN